jgi:hypothetical protein
MTVLFKGRIKPSTEADKVLLASVFIVSAVIHSLKSACPRRSEICLHCLSDDIGIAPVICIEDKRRRRQFTPTSP